MKDKKMKIALAACLAAGALAVSAGDDSSFSPTTR